MCNGAQYSAATSVCQMTSSASARAWRTVVRGASRHAGRRWRRRCSAMAASAGRATTRDCPDAARRRRSRFFIAMRRVGAGLVPARIAGIDHLRHHATSLGNAGDAGGDGNEGNHTGLPRRGASLAAGARRCDVRRGGAGLVPARAVCDAARRRKASPCRALSDGGMSRRADPARSSLRWTDPFLPGAVPSLRRACM